MKDVLKIGIPAMIDSLVTVIVATIDTRMVSVLGKGAVSAVSFTTQPKLIIFSVIFALGSTTSVFVAQALGRTQRKQTHAFTRFCALRSFCPLCWVLSPAF